MSTQQGTSKAITRESESFVTATYAAQRFAHGGEGLTLVEVMRVARNTNLQELAEFARENAQYAIKEAAHYEARGESDKADQHCKEARRFEQLDYQFTKEAIRQENMLRTATALRQAHQQISAGRPIQLATRTEAEALMDQAYGRVRGTNLLRDLLQLQPGEQRITNIKDVFTLTLTRSAENNTTSYTVTPQRGAVSDLKAMLQSAADRAERSAHKSLVHDNKRSAQQERSKERSEHGR